MASTASNARLIGLVLAVLLAAAIAGVATHIPAGVGVIEAVFNPQNLEFLMVYLAVGGVFAALVYGLSRIAVEFFREPDAFLGYFGGFATMGMILSLPLCAVGIWLLLRSRHEPA